MLAAIMLQGFMLSACGESAARGAALSGGYSCELLWGEGRFSAELSVGAENRRDIAMNMLSPSEVRGIKAIRLSDRRAVTFEEIKLGENIEKRYFQIALTAVCVGGLKYSGRTNEGVAVYNDGEQKTWYFNEDEIFPFAVEGIGEEKMRLEIRNFRCCEE